MDEITDAYLRDFAHKLPALSVEDRVAQLRALVEKDLSEEVSALRVQVLFKELVSKWHRETEYSSSITRIVMSPAYQQIIGMGSAVVPLILRQIESEGDNPGHWGWALSAITGEDPVPKKAAGDSMRIAEAWLSWGRSRYGTNSDSQI